MENQWFVVQREGVDCWKTINVSSGRRHVAAAEEWPVESESDDGLEVSVSVRMFCPGVSLPAGLDAVSGHWFSRWIRVHCLSLCALWSCVCSGLRAASPPVSTVQNSLWQTGDLTVSVHCAAQLQLSIFKRNNKEWAAVWHVFRVHSFRLLFAFFYLSIF